MQKRTAFKLCLAGATTKTNILGYVAALPIPDRKSVV